MKLILLFAAVTYVTALGSDRCVWGPSYWCSHISRAKECGAVNHCMSTVWKKQILKPENSEECMYCQFVFNEVKEVLQNTDIQDEISRYVENICNLFPNPDWKATCDGIVKEDLPILIKMLDSEIQSQMICATIGMCSGLEDKYSPYGVSASTKEDVQPPNSTCSDCQKFFKDVQDSVVSQETQSELEQVINQLLCKNIPSFSSICQDFVKEALPQFLKLLSDQIDPNITCRVFGFCTSSGRVDVIPVRNVFRNLKKPSAYRSSEECEACKDLMQEVVSTLRDSSTQAVIKSDIETYVCDNLGGLSDGCRSLVEEYLPMLFELLVNELDPKTVCESVGLCTVPSYLRRLQTTKVIKVEPASLIIDGNRENSLPCESCEFVVRELDNVLRMNKTINVTKSLIKDICNKLPSEDLQNQCNDFVDEYIEMVVDDIAKAIDPKTICTKIGLCAAKLVQGVREDIGCDLCVIGIQEVQHLIANVSTVTITTYAKEACNFLPMNISATCFKYVNEYLPLALELLKNTKDPKEICRLGGLCTSALGQMPYLTKPIPENVVNMNHKDLKLGNVNQTEVLHITSQSQESIQENTEDKLSIPTCQVCKIAITYLKNLIKENSSEAEIEAAVDKLCDVLPTEYRSECTNIVNTYGDQIIQFLSKEAGAEAEEICKFVKLCTSVVSQAFNLPTGILSPVDTLPIVSEENVKGKDITKAKDSEVQVPISCEICDTILIVLKDLIGNNATEAEIEQAVDQLCTYVPSALKSLCDSLVEQYGKEIIDFLVHDINPNTICTELGLCSSMLSKNTISQSGIISPIDTLPIKLEEDKKVKPAVQGMVECDMCKLVLSAMDEDLQQKSTQDEIKNMLLDVCKKLPTEIHSECAQLVNKFYMVAINYLLLSQSPASICEELTFCPSKQESVNVAEGKLSQGFQHRVDGPECVLCEFVMKELENLITENSTQAEIKDALDEVCSLFPSTISEECTDFVNKYSTFIINLLVLYKPSEICSKLGVCNSTSMEGLATLVKILPDKSKVGLDYCGPCKLIVSAARSYLSQNATTQEIINYLNELCDELPDTVTAQCENVVGQYVPAILDLIEQDLTPTQVCQQLGFCNTTQEMKLMKLLQPSKAIPQKVDNKLYFKSHSKILGTKKCTYGPSFWCASSENAKLCNAEEHCQNHVWNQN